MTCTARPWESTVSGDGVVTSAPANLRSTVTGTTVRIEWEPVPAAATFLVEAGSAPTLDNLARFNTGNAATVLQVLDVPGGTYYVRVRGVGPDGLPGPASNEITIRVGACVAAPGPPTGFGAQVSGNQVTLSWIPPVGGNGVSSYIVEAGSSTGLSDIAVFDTGSPATALAATAPNGTYHVRMRARNACGTGPPSNEFVVEVGTSPPGPTQPGTCDYRVSPANVPLSALAGEFTITVDASPGCAWTAASNAPFITLSAGGAPSGRGTARFVVAANNGGATRTGSVRIAWAGGGRDIGVSQAAPPPPPPTTTPRVEDVIRVLPAPPGVVDTVTPVPTPPPPPRPSPSPAPTVTVSPGPAPQTVGVKLSAPEPFNTVIVATDGGAGSAQDRATAMDVSSSHYVIRLTSLQVSVDLAFALQGSQSFVAQFAVSVDSALPGNYALTSIDPSTPPTPTTPCNYLVTPITAGPLAASGGAVDVTVTTAAGCAWSAATSAAFLSVSPASGVGSGTVRVTALSNGGNARSGAVRISWSAGGQDVNVSQQGPTPPSCSYAIAPMSVGPIGASGGTFAVSVKTDPACAWAASATVPFISPTSAAGPGTVTTTFTVAPNSGAARSGLVRISWAGGGQDISVQQAGAACTYSVTPTSINVGANGGTFKVIVTTNNTDCAWSTDSPVPYVNFLLRSGLGTGGTALEVFAHEGFSQQATVRVYWPGGEQRISVSQAASIPDGTYSTSFSTNPVSFGGPAPACSYTQEFLKMTATVTIANGRPSAASVAGTSLERTSSPTCKTFGSTSHAYSLSTASVGGYPLRNFSMVFTQKAGAPAVSLRFDGSVTGLNSLAGTMEFRRVLQPGEPTTLGWSIRTDVTLGR